MKLTGQLRLKTNESLRKTSTLNTDKKPTDRYCRTKLDRSQHTTRL